MSLIDELRNKANAKRQAEVCEQDQQQQREAAYRDRLLPKMQAIFRYVQELVEYLNFLDEPVAVTDYSSRYPRLGRLVQSQYKINTDGYGGFADFDRLQQINVTFFLVGAGEFSYTLEGQSRIEQEIAFLHEKRVPFEWKNTLTPSSVRAASFTVQRRIPVLFRFAVALEVSLIQFSIYNHEAFSVFKKSFEPEALDDQWLDDMSHYLLRRNDQFIRLELPEAHRRHIQHQTRLAIEEQAHLLESLRLQEQPAAISANKALPQLLKAALEKKSTRN